jgi:hypothetical protein
VINAYAAGARLGWARLSTRATLIAFGAALAAVMLFALFERVEDRAFAADRALTGVVFGLAVPLYCFALAELATSRTTLFDAVGALSRHGLPRPSLAQGLIGSIVAPSALGSLAFGVVAVLVTRGPFDPLLARDLLAVSWIGALAGAGYAGLFALGSTFRRGRLWLLLADWLLGAGTGFLALPWPRGHVRNLLGYSPVLDLSQAAAAFSLVLLALLGSLIASRRLPR